MSVGRICRKDVDVAECDATTHDAAARMLQRTLVIVDGDRRPVGIVTDRDLTQRVLAKGRDARTTTVTDVMTELPRTVYLDTPIEEALKVMRKYECRRIPVIDEKGRLEGIVALDDILLLLAREFASIQQLLGSETPEAAARS